MVEWHFRKSHCPNDILWTVVCWGYRFPKSYFANNIIWRAVCWLFWMFYFCTGGGILDILDVIFLLGKWFDFRNSFFCNNI